jgi:hypothetical protein
VIQLQYHCFDYSPFDGEVRSMVYGQEAISWGLQFSYPQLYIDPHSKDICETNKSDAANTQLFRKLQRWLRQYSVPTPFIADGKRFNAPIRIGRGCLPWLQRHPQLKDHGLAIDGSAG